ncbi:MAG: MotA/TolQ/ExbB proton channel family protein [Planctomycetota bacterium]
MSRASNLAAMPNAHEHAAGLLARISQLAWPTAIAVAMACATPAIAGAPRARPMVRGSVWSLFQQSFDIFTAVLVAGSLIAGFVIVRCMLDVRTKVILPPRTLTEIDRLVGSGRVAELREFTSKEHDFASAVVSAAAREHDRGREAMLDAADIAATAEAAKTVRQVELLALIGNIAPLIGLAGTVWGMINAFTSLGATGGDAGPAELSVGISKALFHTLLGLVLAIPAMLVAGVYRSAAERIMSKGVAQTSRLVDRLTETASRSAPAAAGDGPGEAPAP